MPVTFPTHINTHFNEGGAGGLKVMQRRFDLTDPRSMQETLGGEAVVSTYGTFLWFGQVVVVPLHNALQRKLEAKVRALQRSDARFYIGDLMDDPLAGINTSPVIGTVSAADNHVIRIDGMPPSFVLDPGIKLSFSYGGGRTALHETATRAAANASGQLSISVFPIIQPGWVVGNPVTFGSAAHCKAYMVPRSLKTGGAGPDNTEGFTFMWRQTLEI